MHLKDSLVATFNERQAPTFKKYVAEQGIINANLIEDTSIFLVALLCFCFIKEALIMLNFSIFLLLTEPLVATFNETFVLSSRKYVSEPYVIISDFSGKLRGFLVALFHFWFRKIN